MISLNTSKKYLCRFVMNNSLEYNTIFLKIYFKGSYYYIVWKRDMKKWSMTNSNTFSKINKKVYIRNYQSLHTLNLNYKLSVVELGDNFFDMIQSDDTYTRQIARVIISNQLENNKEIKL